MIVDSSAIVAILKGEPEADDFLDALEAAAVCRMSAASFLETAIVIDNLKNPVASREFDDVIRETGIGIEPVTAEQVRVARDAYRDFGKRKGKARLNFGDCFAYALAKTTGEPLLFKGNNFIHTDVTPAIQSRTRRH